MTDYDANGARVSPLMGRLAIGAAQRAHTSAAKFVTHPAQVPLIVELSVTIAGPLKDQKAAEEATADRDLTFCGLPLVEDPKMPETVIELRDKTGGVIARIKNLAVPK